MCGRAKSGRATVLALHGSDILNLEVDPPTVDQCIHSRELFVAQAFNKKHFFEVHCDLLHLRIQSGFNK